LKYKEYLDEHIPYEAVSEPKHLYTITFHKALYSEELFEMYNRYEKAVHDKDRDRD
jgi:arginyl-tRNA--protein-N-Asp/Glu arginylyltransferase